MEPDTELGEKSQAVRDRAVLALLSEKSIPKAAAKCRVGERTLHRWLTSDAAFQAGMSRVQALTGKAIDTLDELLDATKYPNVRLGAARTVAELGIHQHDAETILMRLDELDAAQQRSRQGKTSC